MAKIENLERYLQRLNERRRRYISGLTSGLVGAGLALQGDSMELVPVDLGGLRGTAYVSPPKVTKEEIFLYVGYNSDIAAAVHERPPEIATHGADYNVKHAEDIALGRKYWYQGQMRTYHTRGPDQTHKFLETPLRENSDKYQAIIRMEAIAEE